MCTTHMHTVHNTHTHTYLCVCAPAEQTNRRVLNIQKNLHLFLTHTDRFPFLVPMKHSRRAICIAFALRSLS